MPEYHGLEKAAKQFMADTLINVLRGLRSEDGKSIVKMRVNGKEYPVESLLLIVDEKTIFITDEPMDQEATCRMTRKEAFGENAE